MIKSRLSSVTFQRTVPVLEDIFRIDTRALAVLRMGLGLVILWDLLSRVGWIAPFYSDESFFTRELSRSCNDQAAWSLYWLNGSVWFAQLLFVLTGIAAIALVVGFKTRAAALCCLILCYSQFVRMPLVLDGGHVLLRMILFWSVFLPLGSRWSWDNRQGSSPTVNSVSNLATACIMLQFAMMYFFSGIAKCNWDWWYGNAIQQSLALEMYAWPLADVVRSLPAAVLLWAGRLVVVAEVAGPILIFLPGVYRKARMVFAAFFLLMHIGIWLTLSIGIFAAVAMLSWIIFYPAKPTANLHAARPPVQSTCYYATQILCGLILCMVLFLNISNIDHPWAKFAFADAHRSLAWLTMTAQEFKMFGKPPSHNPRLILMVKMNESDDWQSQPLPYQPIHATRRLNYNLLYFYQLDEPTVTEIRKRWGQYLCHRLNSTNAHSLSECQLVCELEPVAPNAQSSTTIWYQNAHK